MFRGKESSNRIELSQLVQDLLNFGVSGSLQLWGWVDGGGGGLWGWGVVGGCPHTHAHTCTRTCGKHDNFMQMATPLGEPWEFPMSYACVCTCMCVCTCVGGTLSPPPTHIHPPPHPPGGTPGISKNSIALELIKIFQFCLKI